jgi:hypothetical protein
VTLTNRTKKPITRVWPEVIPKQLALDVSDVTFSQPPTTIVDRDPIVLWKLRIKPGVTRTITWSTALPKGGKATKEFLTSAVTWHREAVASTSAVVNDAVRQSSGSNKDAIVSAGESVGGSLPPTGGSTGGDSFGGGTFSGGTSGGGSGTVSGGGGTSGGGGGTKTATRANHAPVITVRNVSSDEETGVSYTVGISDPDGGNVGVSMSGLPPGLSRSGAKVSGRVRQSAVSLTTSRGAIRSRGFTVRVTARDSQGGTTSRSFTWTVRDTHRTMPNFIGTDGNPNPYAITNPGGGKGFYCAYDPNGDGNHIWRQSVAPGQVIRWGQTVYYWYGRNDTSCDHRPKGW